MASKGTPKKTTKKVASKSTNKSGAKPTYAGKKQPQAAQPLLDNRTKRDIGAVVMAVLAIALFVTAFMDSSGFITGALNVGLKHALGLGIYILPVILLVLSALFLIRFEKERVPARSAIGFALIFTSVLTLLALTSIGAEENPNILFAEQMVISKGGLIGAAFGWVFLNLFGMVVSVIICIGVIIIGIVIIGFSISALIEKMQQARAEKDSESMDFSSYAPFARIKRGGSGAEDRLAQNKAGWGATQALAENNFQPIDPSIANAKTSLLKNGADANDAQVTRTLPKKRVAPEKTIVLPSLEEENITGEEAALTRTLPTKEGAAQPKKAPKRAKKQKPQNAAPTPQEGFVLPSMDLLSTSSLRSQSKESDDVLASTGMLLQQTLADFGVFAEVVGWVAGPTVTLFKVDLPSGVRVSKIANLSDDIALALASPGVRIFAPIPGTNYVGIEVPNKTRQTVLLGDVLKTAPEGPLQVAIGKDVEGNCITDDLSKMPHLLIGGTTGSGKSVEINSMIMSILMRSTPAEVRMIMIDPKRVEFTPYNGIPHLYVPVVTECKEAASALSWAVAEMERRLKEFAQVGARNIGQYNAKAQASKNAHEQDPEVDLIEQIPYIVII
ncbi:MAG: DNA translocase FtsK 4TM domain-containing protein, partial [Anaerotardibacter sp.]